MDGSELTLHNEGDAPENDCTFPTTVVDNVVRVALFPCWDENSIDVQWTVGSDAALDLTVVDVDPSFLFPDNSSWFGRTWERVE